MTEYRAKVIVLIEDPISMKELCPVVVRVRFTEGDDPREMLARRAIEAAAEHARLAERFMWL